MGEKFLPFTNGDIVWYTKPCKGRPQKYAAQIITSEAWLDYKFQYSFRIIRESGFDNNEPELAEACCFSRPPAREIENCKAILKKWEHKTKSEKSRSRRGSKPTTPGAERSEPRQKPTNSRSQSRVTSATPKESTSLETFVIQPPVCDDELSDEDEDEGPPPQTPTVFHFQKLHGYYQTSQVRSTP